MQQGTNTIVNNISQSTEVDNGHVIVGITFLSIILIIKIVLLF